MEILGTLEYVTVIMSPEIACLTNLYERYYSSSGDRTLTHAYCFYERPPYILAHPLPDTVKFMTEMTQCVIAKYVVSYASYFDTKPLCV